MFEKKKIQDMNHFAKNIKHLRLSKGLKQSEIEGLIGIKRSTWNNYESGYSSPEIDKIIVISSFFEVSLDDLLSHDLENVHLNDVLGDDKKHVKSTPKSTPNSTPNDDFLVKEPHEEYVKSVKKGALPLIPVEAAAGYMSGSVQVLNHEVTEWYSVPEFTRIGANFLISVKGQSMHPIYYSGDLLACKKITDTFIQWGKVYVLDTDQGPVVKRLYPGKSEYYVECRSENSDLYPPYQLPKDQIRSMCLVVGLIRFE